MTRREQLRGRCRDRIPAVQLVRQQAVLSIQPHEESTQAFPLFCSHWVANRRALLRIAEQCYKGRFLDFQNGFGFLFGFLSKPDMGVEAVRVPAIWGWGSAEAVRLGAHLAGPIPILRGRPERMPALKSISFAGWIRLTHSRPVSFFV